MFPLFPIYATDILWEIRIRIVQLFSSSKPYLIFQKLGLRYLWKNATECDMGNLKMVMKSIKSSGWSFKTLEYLKANKFWYNWFLDDKDHFI